MEYVSRISGVCGGRIAFSDWYGYTKSMENEKAIPGGRVDGSGNREVRGTWRFSGEHPLFDEHFPGAPRVPGTLVIEAMRAGAEALFPGWRVLGVKRFRFRHFIEPGAYDYAFTPQPDAAAIRCVLLSGERRMAEGTLLVAADPARGRHEVAFQRAYYHYGGSSQLGMALARALREEGAKTLSVCRSSEGLAHCGEAGLSCLPLDEPESLPERCRGLLGEPPAHLVDLMHSRFESLIAGAAPEAIMEWAAVDIGLRARLVRAVGRSMLAHAVRALRVRFIQRRRVPG